MKALSIRQPWAELILQGRKTIELRTWRTDTRGRFAIHAGQTVEEEACIAYGLDPARVVRGALVGTVQLADILRLDEAVWEVLRDQHLSLRDFPGPMFGWRLEDPQRLPQPIPLRGRMSLFNVPDEVVGGKAPPPPRVPYTAQHDASAYDPEKPFELRVAPGDGGDYGLALYQWPLAAHAVRESNTRPTKPQRLVSLAGDSLRAVADHVLAALRKSGYKVTDLSHSRRKPFRLDEETGLRLGLLFLAIKPLSRMDRVEAISSRLRTMSSEEAYYWFSKCTAEVNAANAQRALRILLADE